MTQAELAGKLHVTRQAVSRYELGESFPDIAILVQIAGVFSITLDELIGNGNGFGNGFELNNEGIDITHIVSLVRYINSRSVLQLDGSLLEQIIPFLDIASKEVILKKIIEGESDWRLVKMLLPYIGNMATQLEAAVIDGALPKGVLDMMNEYFLKERIK
jgi:transcriptional regulator with XRE-family HTH domain